MNTSHAAVDRFAVNNHPSRVAASPIAAIERDANDWLDLSTVSGAEIERCWTCGACDNGCPVNVATGRLRPQRNVRMAVYGMLDDLLSLPDIWYCLSCRRCLQGCPNRVKPFELHRYLQNEAIRQGLISNDFVPAYRRLLAEFQRVRWRAAAYCFKGRLDHLSDQAWYRWLKKPLHDAIYRPVKLGFNREEPQPKALLNGQSCFTCGECSGCCPITCDGAVFDPQRIIRMVNLGLSDELLKSPTIWLCLGCRRCAESCSQTVSGLDIIHRLRQQAIAKGFVDPLFPNRLFDADRVIYPKFLYEIDTLIGLYGMPPAIHDA